MIVKSELSVIIIYMSKHESEVTMIRKPKENKQEVKLITVRVSPEEHAQIKSMADASGTTMTELILSGFITKERKYEKRSS